MLNKEQLLILISKALKIPKKKINMDLKLGELEEWDSLGQLSILSSLDKATKGKTSKISSLAEAYSVKKILSILNKNKI